ncbi:MAG: phytanoyl-CoA dioxygenase family protein [Candidatus Poribacteria bacterium]|nr:phytanoyl-CoA dioxygenase family protein [Candidatus Poribacteria bacterium]
MKINDSDMQKQFVNNGFYVFRSLLEPDLIDRLRRITDGVLDQQDEVHFEQQRAPGSMVMIDWDMAYRYDALAELIVHPQMLNGMAQLGFAQPKFGHGRIISKPPHSPRLFWHEDGRFWDDPVSYTPQPIQCFLMYYLVDTTPENGCLRVIPGSHLKRHALHDQVPERHTEKLSSYADPEHVAFQHAEGEIDVPLKAGDAVMGYGTLFHSAHANRTDQRRTGLTMWYYPDFADLPESTQATVVTLETNAQITSRSPGRMQRLMEPLRMVYEGDAEPIPQQWTPGVDLR